MMVPIARIACSPGLKYQPSTKLIIQVRNINLDRLSNKRITRLESDIELHSEEHKSRLINRNPQNLEQLSFEQKPSGFWLDHSPPSHWNKLVLEKRGKFLNAYLRHWSGKNLVEASTKEPQLSKYFKSPKTTQAAIILAHTIARRCLQSGYIYAGVDDFDEGDTTSIKTKTFFEVVESSGLQLKEPPEITPRSNSDV